METCRPIMNAGLRGFTAASTREHILSPMSKTMGDRTGETKWYEMSRHLEKKAKEAFKERKGRDIYVNVDFYSASLYYYMGIPADLFTPLFAIARIAGWTSHVIEEQFGGAAAKPVLYRPDSEYVGDYCGPDVCKFSPIDTR